MTAKGQPRRSMLLVSLVNTGAMWGWAASPMGAATAPSPLLAATAAPRGGEVSGPPAGATLPQPEGAPALEMTGLPAGFWAGRVSELCGGVCLALLHVGGP